MIERTKPIPAALNYYAGPFFAMIGQSPNRTSRSYREHGQGNLSCFFMGRPFLNTPLFEYNLPPKT